ncbi:MAG: DUF1365 domain-containing protein [Luteolibacter sp.]|uniref:DUF1365 domain-containing protein n=1 Tax=Luteolibacter sp. TaxID=1962973 RepID=UPI0032669D4B
MNALYECTIVHCRLKPKRNPFTYRVFMFSVDIDDLPTLGKRTFGFSHNRFNLFSIDDKDHVDLGKSGGIRGNLNSWLEGQGISCPNDAKIRLLTFPRVLGYGFNPVSFYYVESNSGEPIAAVAEVVNTFREMKLYAMESIGADDLWQQRVAKDFYVSPFSDPGDEFDFKLGIPGETWRVNIDDYSAGERVLLSSVRGERRELTSLRLLGYAFKYPLLSLKIIGLIHWHALLLWIRKVPFFRKSERREAQLDVMRPHSSLKKNLP